ncbi:hypothetical protein D043_0153A, partial [Vibrio parahaemolyticus EKP-021]
MFSTPEDEEDSVF